MPAHETAHRPGTEPVPGPAADASNGRRTLLLVRHATADTPPATSDRGRPLSAHGRTEAAELGRWLAGQLSAGRWPAPDLVLCSPSRRTRETLQAMAVDAETCEVEDVYGGGVPDILQALTTVPAAATTVLVVGHSPGIPATAVDLDDIARETGEEDAGLVTLTRFPPASLAVLRTTAAWVDLPEHGAALVDVRHP